MTRTEGIALIGIIIAAVIGLPTWLTYLNGPRLEALGDATSWFIPQAFSGTAINTFYIGEPDPDIGPDYLKNVRSFVNISLRNKGKSTAEDVHVNLSYAGVYSFDSGKTLKSYEGEISIAQLLPDENRVISIWTNATQSEVSYSGTLINFKNGSTHVDFGNHFYGWYAFVADVIYRLKWLLFLLIAVVGIAVIVEYFQKKNKLRASGPWGTS